MAAAYRIVARVPHDAAAIPADVLEAEVDETWSDADVALLLQSLRWLVTPMSVSRTEGKEAIAELGGPASDGAIREARSQLLRGYAEAHDRAALLDHPEIAFGGHGVHGLLDDGLIGRVLSGGLVAPAGSSESAGSDCETLPAGSSLFANPSELRFSEIIQPTLNWLKRQKRWKSDMAQRVAIAERFAWITGDKPLADYSAADVQTSIDTLYAISSDFRWGKLGKEGPMAVPFAEFELPPVEASKKRNDRTVNRDLSVMQGISEQLADTHWRPRYGPGVELNFMKWTAKVEIDPERPVRMPWTPEHPRTMYSLPLWQGGGGKLARLKDVADPGVYQDAAFWVPLLGTYTGLAREKICGLEIEDFDFASEIPFLLVRNNMTRSKDGVTPGGLKRSSRYRAMPLHPELLDLGIEDYVNAIGREQGYSPGKVVPIFPELYFDEAKYRSGGEIAPERGGRRFYKRAWVCIGSGEGKSVAHPSLRCRSSRNMQLRRLRYHAMAQLAEVFVSEIPDPPGGSRNKQCFDTLRAAINGETASMGKFTPLADYCREQTLREFELSFLKIESIIESKLPDSALRPQYWANVVDGTGPVRSAMKSTRYETFLIDGSRRVRFERKR